MSYDMMAKLMSATAKSLLPQRWLLAVALFGVLVGPSGVGAQEAGSAASVASQLSAELARYFPPVAGEVIKVDGKRLYVDLGAKDEVWTGLRLLVFRAGEALKHPATGEVIGHDERPLGYMTLVRISENHAVGVYMAAAEGVAAQPGDRVRLSAGRIDVGLLPPTGAQLTDASHAELGIQLKDALEATGRFRVQGAERVNAWLLERRLTPDAAVQTPYLQMLTQALDTPYLAQPIIKAAQGQAILTLSLLAATQTEPVAQTAAAFTAAAVASASPAAPPAPAAPNNLGGLFIQPWTPQVGGFPWNLAEGMSEIHRFDDELIGLDASDPDGDGRVDVVLATASRVSLYQLSGGSLQVVDEMRVGNEGRIISAQLVRLDAASPLGVVVNHQVNAEGVESFVLALQGGKLAYWQQRIYETLLAVDSDGDGVNDRIWGQPLDRERFFSRDAVRVYQPGNGELQFQNNLKVPYPFRATGAALAGLGSGGEAERQLVFVDERHHLQVYRGKEKLWESPAYVGGGYGEAQLPQSGEMDVRLGDVIKQTFPFEPIPQPVDVDGDGVDEVLVIRNGANVAGVALHGTRYTTGDIALLRAGPYGYTLSPVSPKFDGMVSGVSVAPSPASGVLIAVSKRQGILGRKKQTIVFLSRLPLS